MLLCCSLSLAGKRKNLTGESLLALLWHFYNHASKWHRFKKFTLRTGQTEFHPLCTLAPVGFQPPKWQIATVTVFVNDIHEINVRAATGLYLPLYIGVLINP